MLYTLGHSTLSWDEFMALTQGLDLLVDVRSHAGAHCPHFQQEHMQQRLGSLYEWWTDLGGWTASHLRLQDQFPEVDLIPYARRKFPKHRIAQTIAPQAGPSWTNRGLLDYAYYMVVPEFLIAANKLLALASDMRVGIFCCEALYYKCHRSMIADYAVFMGHDAVHLLGRATKTRGYRVAMKSHQEAIGNRLERYPARVLAVWESIKANS